MPSQNISPLGKPIATLCLFLPLFHSSRAEHEKAEPLAQREGGVFSQPRASWLVKGFENAPPLGLSKHRALLCFFSSVSIREIRG